MFVYYGMLLEVVPYGLTLLQTMPTIGTFYSTIPPDTTLLVQLLMYIIVPLVAIAYTIKSSSPENQIVVQQ
jgi:hypothetical protein